MRASFWLFLSCLKSCQTLPTKATSVTLGEGEGMGDEVSFGITNVYFGILQDDGTYADGGFIGEAVSFDIEPRDDDVSVWADALASMPCGSFRLDIEWWSMNRFLTDVLAHRPMYTVRGLRRNGKSHRRRR